jgi:hypothetical protein
MAWRCGVHWFYGQLDTVFVNSEEYRQSWMKRGFAAKLKFFRAGSIPSCFILRDANGVLRRSGRAMARFASFTWAAFPAKDLDLPAAAYRQLRDEGLSVNFSSSVISLL